MKVWYNFLAIFSIVIINSIGEKMLKKIIVGMLLFATLSFGMTLSKLNSASKAELMEINGIGEVKAGLIFKEKRKGKFKSFADLIERVDGIGEQTAANIKGGVKNADDVKKVAKKKTTSKKRSTSKKKTTAKKSTSKKAAPKKTRKKKTTTKKKKTLKKADDKEKELKKKTRKKKLKKTKTKKTKTKKTKTKN